jgi:O-methyltransferase
MVARQMYCDLLVRIIANTIYADPSGDPWHERRFDPEARTNGRDWPTVAHSMAGTLRLDNLKDLTQRVLDEGVPGDFIETGVWRGGCCILMRGVLAANGVADRRVYVADSFAGLPPPDAALYPADAGDAHSTHAELAISVEQVRENFARYGLLDAQVVFLEGWFEDTLPTLGGNRFALIRLDGDMYGSTICSLRNLYPRLSSGGFAIIDDYHAVPGCRQAVHDYFNETGIAPPLVEIDWTGIYWRKE